GWITSPHDRRVVVGTCHTASAEAIDKALTAAKAARGGWARLGARGARITKALPAAKAASGDWDSLGGEARATILERAADLFEADRAGLMALMVREAGKTLPNAPRDGREP